MEINTKVSGLGINEQDGGSMKTLLLERNTRENGKTEISMARESLFSLMGSNISENGEKAKNMAMAF